MECVRVSHYYEVRNRSTISKDMAHLVETLKMYGPLAKRVIVYCRSLDMCADLYEHFLCSLGVSRPVTILLVQSRFVKIMAAT